MSLITAHRCWPCRGETRSGDAVIVRAAGDTTLLALIDALGHGPFAADVAERAVEFLDAVPLEGGLRRIVQGLHRALRGTRGAAATICLVGSGGLEAAGVGNVRLRIFGAPISVLLSPGILGTRLRELRLVQAELPTKARLLFHSDGVRAEFSDEATLGSPEEACEAILRRHASSADDATILIADIP